MSIGAGAARISCTGAAPADSRWLPCGFRGRPWANMATVFQRAGACLTEGHSLLFVTRGHSPATFLHGIRLRAPKLAKPLCHEGASVTMRAFLCVLSKGVAAHTLGGCFAAGARDSPFFNRALQRPFNGAVVFLYLVVHITPPFKAVVRKQAGITVMVDVMILTPAYDAPTLSPLKCC